MNEMKYLNTILGNLDLRNFLATPKIFFKSRQYCTNLMIKKPDEQRKRLSVAILFVVMEVGQIALPPPDPPDPPDPPKPTLSKFERFMLGVAIVLPTVDNYTDVNFGVRLLTGLYDQGWTCQRKIPPTRYDEIDLNQNFSYEEFIKFSDTDPTNNGKLII